MKRLFFVSLLLGIMAATFYIGLITGNLKNASLMEASYPEDLHQLLSKDTYGCDQIKNDTNFGPYRVELLEGDLLRIISFDAKNKTLAVSLLDLQHRQAVMTWEEACE